jgi:hypothetical protein
MGLIDGIAAEKIDSIDTSKSHDLAMRVLEDAGVYVFFVRRECICVVCRRHADSQQVVSTSKNSINRMDPDGSYTAATLKQYFKTLDVMSRYTNTLGVLAANSVVNFAAKEQTIPVIAAVVRDMKQYMKLKAEATGQRILPVGYSASDSQERQLAMLRFLTSPELTDHVDFWTVRSLSVVESLLRPLT